MGNGSGKLTPVSDSRRKIFCAGLNKTGTSTLVAACEILGLRAVGFSLEVMQDVWLQRD
jgi:hypothetical protein